MLLCDLVGRSQEPERAQSVSEVSEGDSVAADAILVPAGSMVKSSSSFKDYHLSFNIVYYISDEWDELIEKQSKLKQH